MSYTSLQYHIVFSTKDHRPFISEEVRTRLIDYIGGIIRSLDGKLLEVNGPQDHLHLAVSTSAQSSPADLVRDIKANSSRWIHKTFDDMKGFGWQDGYAAFSVSHSAMPKVIEYIRHQQDHHKQLSFHEELVALLQRHEIAYDERYIVA